MLSPYERRRDLVIIGLGHIADGLALILTAGSWRKGGYALKTALRKVQKERDRRDSFLEQMGQTYVEAYEKAWHDGTLVYHDAYDAGYGGQGG